MMDQLDRVLELLSDVEHASAKLRDAVDDEAAPIRRVALVTASNTRQHCEEARALVQEIADEQLALVQEIADELAAEKEDGGDTVTDPPDDA